MDLSGKRILVTGAGGFIGSHLVEELLRRGNSVRAMVHYNSRNHWGWLESLEPSLKSRLDVFAGEICDPFGVKEAMKDCQVVFHLAALIAIPYSYHSPAAYVDTNIKGTLNILQAGRELGVKKIVQTSTSEVYGTARYVPIDEEHPLQGQSPYSASKIGADQIALSFYRSFGTPVAVIRPFNTYGPRQSARAVIPTIITQIASGKQEICLGATHPTRDFNYVSDTVDGFIKMAETDASTGQVINIGSNYEISILETAHLVAQLMGHEIRIQQEEIRLRPENSEVERLWASNEKAIKVLGWSPQFAGMDGLRKGLERTIEWFGNRVQSEDYKSQIYNL